MYCYSKAWNYDIGIISVEHSFITNHVWINFFKFFTEYGLSRLEKIIVPVTEPGLQQALQNYTGKPQPTNGNGKAMAPNRADMISAAAGPMGQGASPA